MNTSHAAIAVKPEAVRSGKAPRAEIIDSEEPCGLISTIRLARTHASRNRFLLAAELHELVYRKTGNGKAILKIEALAESALEAGRPSVAEAIYVKLCRMTGDEKYIGKATSIVHN
ncbi:MAG: hypothetical protein NTY68_05175 [Candidatus Micrarchaeota archaeon]|nr:hypothetical protein [Candidatus Micrarchaeota archaeon]